MANKAAMGVHMTTTKTTELALWNYWLVRDNADNPIELVRSNQKFHLVVAGEGKGITQHKGSQYFTKENQPDVWRQLSWPVWRQLGWPVRFLTPA